MEELKLSAASRGELQFLRNNIIRYSLATEFTFVKWCCSYVEDRQTYRAQQAY